MSILLKSSKKSKYRFAIFLVFSFGWHFLTTAKSSAFDGRYLDFTDSLCGMGTKACSEGEAIGIFDPALNGWENFSVKFTEQGVNGERDYIFKKNGEMTVMFVAKNGAVASRSFFLFPRVRTEKSIYQYSPTEFLVTNGLGQKLYLQRQKFGRRLDSYRLMAIDESHIPSTKMARSDRGLINFSKYKGFSLEVKRGTFKPSVKVSSYFHLKSVFRDGMGGECKVLNREIFTWSDKIGFDLELVHKSDQDLKRFLISYGCQLNFSGL